MKEPSFSRPSSAIKVNTASMKRKGLQQQPGVYMMCQDAPCRDSFLALFSLQTQHISVNTLAAQGESQVWLEVAKTPPRLSTLFPPAREKGALCTLSCRFFCWYYKWGSVLLKTHPNPGVVRFAAIRRARVSFRESRPALWLGPPVCVARRTADSACCPYWLIMHTHSGCFGMPFPLPWRLAQSPQHPRRAALLSQCVSPDRVREIENQSARHTFSIISCFGVW